MTTLILIIAVCLLLALVYYYQNHHGLTKEEKQVLALMNELWGPQTGTDEQTLSRGREIINQLKKINDTPHFPADLVPNLQSAAKAFLDCFELLEQQNQAISKARNLFWQLRVAIGEWTRFTEPAEVKDLMAQMRKNPIFEEQIT